MGTRFFFNYFQNGKIPKCPILDEEIGGYDGMEKFVLTERFKQLNVGFVLDEGLASEDDTYRLFYAERCVWCQKNFLKIKLKNKNSFRV